MIDGAALFLWTLVVTFVILALIEIVREILKWAKRRWLE